MAWCALSSPTGRSGRSSRSCGAPRVVSTLTSQGGVGEGWGQVEGLRKGRDVGAAPARVVHCRVYPHPLAPSLHCKVYSVVKFCQLYKIVVYNKYQYSRFSHRTRSSRARDGDFRGSTCHVPRDGGLGGKWNGSGSCQGYCRTVGLYCTLENRISVS